MVNSLEENYLPDQHIKRYSGNFVAQVYRFGLVQEN